MDDALLNIVLERLDKVSLTGQATALLLSALEGDESLARELDTGAADKPHSVSPGESAPEPVGAYLKSLTVSGFRGIGPAATLEIPPQPGLILIVGRNGSGKSSFAEALEVLLTGTLMRWETAKSTVFRNGWQNKHAAAGTTIRAETLVEGKGPVCAERTWAPGAALIDSAAWLQANGEKRQPGLDGLGWADDLTTYRPFLSHNELEAFFGTPSELYDLLASVLGLEDLTVAASRLNTARKARDDELAKVKQRLEPLLDRLRALDDDRARECLTALSGRAWDIPAARRTASGATPPSGTIDVLQQLRNVRVPSPGPGSDPVEDLRSAADALDQVAGTGTEQSRQLAGLLESALNHHQAHGDGDCPVCGRPGALTGQWQEETRRQVARLREEARAAEEAVTGAKQAAEQARALMQPSPPVLNEEVDGVDPASARDAWRHWATCPEGTDLTTSAGLRILAEHIATAGAALTTAIATLTAASATELSRRDDKWAPLAAEITSWCADAEKAQRASEPVKALRDAKKWLVDATDDLRNSRLEPLAGQSRAIWAKLRQESNVDLGAFRLAGSATRRNVELDVSVDGAPGTALGVMSQGEINALALSIFLPRVTMKDSPFRFLVIDDPVQAMDPAKVDGLARVLADVAADRQVIVFTHDNRLASAVKDLSIPATILEVTRRTHSVVDVRPCADPVQQALKDARDLSKDADVPEEVKQRVIPGLCRTALEAAFTEAFWRQQLRAGKSRAEIDAALDGTCKTLNHVAALSISGDSRAGDRILPTLNRWGSAGYANTYQALNRSAHRPYGGDVGDLITDTRKLIDKVGEKLR